MATIKLNQSKKLFLTQSCLKDQKTMDYILKATRKQNFPEKNIIKGVNIDITKSGDYLVRCLDDTVHLFEIQLTIPSGFTTNLLGNL
ncbi:MAG TPA: hypothetical protein VEU72_00720 [Nitrosopumilaceae archaeon]|nr:hypothetical protein [Nitrosopumilaceae archaeon]